MEISLDSQPIEFKNFSGGLTDHTLQGDPKRYRSADNFLITVDEKLLERDGTVIYDPTGYSLKAGTRVAGLFTGINETLLFGHAARDLYTQTPAPNYATPWSRILGPTGNEALGGGTNYAQVTTGEFQRQIYYTSDAGIQPGKLFRDQNNSWKAVTAGLPKLQFTPNYPDDSSLLAKAISLANQLRASFIAHINDNAGAPFFTTSNYQHADQDKWSLSYFQAVVWTGFEIEYPGPIPTPTPAPEATDATSLYALCVALALAYEHHRKDAAGENPSLGSSVGAQNYHQPIVIYPDYLGLSGTAISGLGLAAKLTLSGAVTNPQKAAAFLDEVCTKWYWHQLLPYVHSSTNDYALMSRYLLSGTGNDANRIGPIYSSPTTVQVTPNYGDFVALSYWVTKAMNAHANGPSLSQQHSQIDIYGLSTLPNPVDYDSAVLGIFWARYLYGQFHVVDANVKVHNRITFTTTAGSTNLTSVVLTSSGSAVTLSLGDWILTSADVFNDSLAHNRRAARVTASGAGTATVSRTAIANGVAVTGESSSSWLHGTYKNGGITDAACDTTTYAADASEFLSSPSTIGVSLSSWIALATEFLTVLGAHENNAARGVSTVVGHAESYVMGNDLSGVAPSNNNPFFIPSQVTYAYAAFYRYGYTVEPNGLFYLNQGAPIFSNSIQTCPSYPVGTALPSFNSTYFPGTINILVQNPCATMTGLPGLVNTTLTNYDTTISVAPPPTTPGSTGYLEDFTIELYRTTNGGTTFYFLDSLVNTTPTQNYLDVTNESSPIPGTTALNLGKVMYTSGGVLANDQPPISKFVHQLGGFMYYGGITDTGQFFPQRIRQSIQGEPDSAPATSFDDLEDELVGISSTRSNLIAICKNSVYRVSGSFTSTGQGSMTHEKISDAMGGLSAKSIVRTEIGVFFAGTDGFYYTDGYQLIKISLDLDKTYRSMTTSDSQKARIYGCYDKLTRRIWWAMQSEPTGADNDTFFIFYLDYGVKPSGVFTKALTQNSWNPASHAFFQGRLIVGDSRGYLFKSDPYTKTDPLINTGTAPSLWRTVYIPYNYTSCDMDMGTSTQRKWITKIHAVGENVGNAAIQIKSTNDSGTSPNGDTSTLSLAPIQYTANLMWGDPRVVWGDSTFAWKYDGNMDLWRRFPSKSLRSDFKRIQYVPGFFTVYRSDDWPEFAFALVDSVALTATLVTPSGYSSLTWPLDIVDYYLSFDTDDYVNQYLIASLDATKKIATLLDPSATLVTTSTAKWQIKGIKKEQRVKITSFDVHMELLGEEFQAYPGRTGANGMGDNG